MSSKWTNKSAIMRDLARLQGRVPVAVKSTVAAGDQPPNLNIVEETEEEFYRQGVGEGDFAAPELHLIQEMLDLVRDQDLGDEDSNTAYEIAKVNFRKNQNSPNKARFNVKNRTKDKAGTSNPTTGDSRSNRKNAKEIIEQIIGQEKTYSPASSSGCNTKTRRRNVAIESIMESFNSFGSEHSNQSNVPVNETNNNPVKLLKPNDFQQVSSSTDKVHNWFHEQETSSSYSFPSNSPTFESITKPPKVIEKSKNIKSPKTKEQNVKSQNEKVEPTWTKMDFDPSSMFKRKAISVKVKESDVVVQLPTKQENTPKNYVPSSVAEEYYKKYMINQIILEDIWMKVEKRIDEIEELKEAEAEKQRLLEEAEKQKLLEEAEKERLLKEAEKEQALIEAAKESEINSNDNDLDRSIDQQIEDDGPIRELDSVIINEKTEPHSIEQKLAIYLPVHRHLLTENCIVCEVLCGKKSKSTEEKSSETEIENWREKSE